MAKLKGNRNVSKEAEELLGFGQQVFAWVNERPKQVAAAAGGAVLVVLLLLGTFFLMGRAVENRIDRVSAAVSAYAEARNFIDDGVVQRLRDLAEKYGRHDQGGQARFFLAGSLAASGDFQGAADEYERVAGDFSDNAILSASAKLGLGYSYRMMGENERAIEVFTQLLGESGTPLPRSQIHMEVGRAYEALEMPDEALKAYRTVVDSFPESALQEQAKQKVLALEGA